MSDDFKIKIKSEVDLSDAKKKIDDFTKTEHKVKFKTDTSDFDKVTEKVKPKDVEVKTKVTGQEKISSLKKDIDGAKKSTEGLADSFKSISKIGLQIDLFREIEQQAKKAVQAVKEIDDAIVSLQNASNLSYNNVRNMMSVYNDMAKQLGATTTELDKLLEKYKELGIVKEEQSDGTYTLHFDGNAMEIEETLNSFMTDLRGIADKNGGDYGYLDGIVQYTSGELDSAKKVIEEYSEIYNSALQADMLSKGYGKDSPAATYKDYADAIDEYNSALLEGDTSKIENAKTSFDKVQKSVDGVLKKYPEYKSLFSELSDSLDVTSIKAKEFQDTLNQDGFKELIEQLKNLKDVDLKGINFNDDVVSDGEKALKKVIDKAIELGIVSDKSTESISKIVDMLVDMGYTGTQSTESLNKSFEQANTSIQTATSNVSKLKDIMAESVSGAGISPKNLKVFREMFGDDAEKALEKTADGFHINRKALSELQKQQEEMTQTDYFRH